MKEKLAARGSHIAAIGHVPHVHNWNCMTFCLLTSYQTVLPVLGLWPGPVLRLVEKKVCRSL